MKGTVCQLHYQGGGCLRSVHPRPDGSSCEAAWPFATAPQELKVGDDVTFTLTEGGQAVDLKVGVSEPKTERDPEPALTPRTDEGEAALKVRAEAAAQRKLQRNMNRFHNANLEEQLEMLRRAEERLNTVKAGDEMDGTALCSLVNKLAGFLHAPGGSIAVASGTGGASAVAGSRNAGLQQKVRKLLIGCLELLDLSDSRTYERVGIALQHIAQLVILKKLNPNQPDKDPSSSLSKKRSLAVDQWQTLAALVGTNQDDALPLAPADAVPGEAGKRTGIKNKDMASTQGRHYRPSSKVRSLPFVRENNLDVVTLKCSECHQTLTSSWFWQHPKKETVHVLVPSFGHSACTMKMGKRCPWLPLDGRPRVLDNFHLLDFCVHKRQRPNCVACGGSGICEHKRRYRRCKFCKASRANEARNIYQYESNYPHTESMMGLG